MKGFSLVPLVMAVGVLFAAAPEARAQVGHMHAQRGGQEPLLVLDNQLWWFNGQSPPGYATTGTLSVKNAVGPFTFYIIQGSDKVNFTNGNANVMTVPVTTVGMSDPGYPHDVVFQVESYPSGKLLATASATVYAPDWLQHDGDDDIPSPAWGYESHIHYNVMDQFDGALTTDVPVNEQFDSPVVPDTQPMSTAWNVGPPGGCNAPSGYFFDRIGGAALNGETLPIPVPVLPRDPDAGGQVCHWTGTWSVGSAQPGLGKQVDSDIPWVGGNECKWQNFLGYARHE